MLYYIEQIPQSSNINFHFAFQLEVVTIDKLSLYANFFTKASFSPLLPCLISTLFMMPCSMIRIHKVKHLNNNVEH